MDNVNQDTEHRSSELEQKQEEMRKRHTRELSASSEEEQSLTQITSNIPGVAPLGEDGLPIRRSTWVQTQKQFRAFLEDYDDKEKLAKDLKDKRTRIRKILDALLETATDSKNRSQVAAANLLIERGYGKAASSEEDLEAARAGGMKVIVMNAPPQRAELPPKPDRVIPVLEAEIVESTPRTDQ